MHLVLNGWFWDQLTTGSGQYLHYLVQYSPEVAPQHTYTLVLPRALFANSDSLTRHSSTPPRGLRDAPRQPATRNPLPIPWRVELAGTPFDRLSENLAKVWFEQVSFPLACRRLRADVAHTPYWGSPWWRPCRTAVTVHDLIPLLLPEYRGGVQQRLYTLLVARTARRAYVVLTDSQASRQDIVEHLGIPAGGVHAVLLAADERFCRVTDEAELARVREKYKLPGARTEPGQDERSRDDQGRIAPTEKFILYLGGFDVRKNVPRLVRAYAQFVRQCKFAPDTPRLVLAGKLPAADTAFAPHLKPVVDAEGIGEWVHFAGWVDEADKPALYSLAALFVFPSLYEGFGLPVAEAAACGTPVLTSNRSSLPEVAAGAVLVDPEDVGGIADGIGRALSSPPSPSTTHAYTWKNVAHATLEVL